LCGFYIFFLKGGIAVLVLDWTDLAEEPKAFQAGIEACRCGMGSPNGMVTDLYL
jgi:hypothetical protein